MKLYDIWWVSQMFTKRKTKKSGKKVGQHKKLIGGS